MPTKEITLEAARFEDESLNVGDYVGRSVLNLVTLDRITTQTANRLSYRRSVKLNARWLSIGVPATRRRNRHRRGEESEPRQYLLEIKLKDGR